MLLRIGSKLEIEANVLGGFHGKEFIKLAFGGTRKFGNAHIGIGLSVSYQWNAITLFGFDRSTVAVFFESRTIVDTGGALELTKSFAERSFATTQNPVNHLTFVHII